MPFSDIPRPLTIPASASVYLAKCAFGIGKKAIFRGYEGLTWHRLAFICCDRRQPRRHRSISDSAVCDCYLHGCILHQHQSRHKIPVLSLES